MRNISRPYPIAAKSKCAKVQVFMEWFLHNLTVEAAAAHQPASPVTGRKSVEGCAAVCRICCVERVQLQWSAFCGGTSAEGLRSYSGNAELAISSRKDS